MIEALAVVRFIRALVATDELLSVEIGGGVVAFGEDNGEDDDHCGPMGGGASGLPRVVSVQMMSGQDENSLGLERVTSDQLWSVKVYGQAGERFADIKPLANQLDLLLQGARNLDTDPRFTVARVQTLMDREAPPESYPYLGGIYRFLITPDTAGG